MLAWVSGWLPRLTFQRFRPSSPECYSSTCLSRSSDCELRQSRCHLHRSRPGDCPWSCSILLWLRAGSAGWISLAALSPSWLWATWRPLFCPPLSSTWLCSHSYPWHAWFGRLCHRWPEKALGLSWRSTQGAYGPRSLPSRGSQWCGTGSLSSAPCNTAWLARPKE